MRPYILITNDDGIDAPGITKLTEIMSKLGDIILVAPDGARSGQSNAITVTKPLRYKLVSEEKGIKRYVSNGTPTDCVKLALNQIVERKPDLLVSGINHGSNATINVIYSGTMGAVFEGCENEIPAIGFSIDDHSFKADFSHFEPYILKICEETLKNGLPERVCLNVNAPLGKIKGVKVARQCNGKWVEEFIERKHPMMGERYFWLTGRFDNKEEESKDTDQWAIKNSYVSIAPTTIDMTAYKFMSELEKWNF